MCVSQAINNDIYMFLQIQLENVVHVHLKHTAHWHPDFEEVRILLQKTMAFMDRGKLNFSSIT